MSAAAVLTIMKNGETIRSQLVDQEAVIGRSEGCLIRLEDRAISRQHAVVRATGTGFQVEKKSEFAAVAVNGADCTSALLKEGDVIGIGPYVMRFSLVAGDEEKSESPAASAITATAEISLRPAAEAPAAEPAAALVLEPAPDPVAEAPAPAPNPVMESAPEISPAEAPVEPAPPLSDVPVEAPKIELGDGIPEPPKLELPGDVGLAASEGLGESPALAVPVHSDSPDATKLTNPQKVIARLLVEPGGSDTPEVLMDKDEIVIGRGKTCDVVLNDKKSSRKHAMVRRMGAKFMLQDLGSANGTYVNGKSVKEHELAGDDRIQVGEVQMVFKAQSSDYLAQASDLSAVQLDHPSHPSGPTSDPKMAALNPNASPVSLANHVADQGLAVPGLVHPAFNAGGIPVTGGKPAKRSLMQKFRELPPGRQRIWAAIIIGVLYFVFFDDDAPVKKMSAQKQQQQAKATGATGASGALGMKMGPGGIPAGLKPEDIQYLDSQQALALEYFKNRDYDKALYEIRKIFAKVPDYKDARAIERYALEGQRKLEAIQEEKRKKEEEAKLKAKVDELVGEAEKQMKHKKYDAASELFAQIVALDPENSKIAGWKKEIDDYQEKKAAAEQQRRVQREINKRGWQMVREGTALADKEKYYAAIATLRKIPEIGATDRRLASVSRHKIHEIRRELSSKRDPALAEAKRIEDSGDLFAAYELYRKASRIDPRHPAAHAAMARIRSTLHDRAKVIYTEAILAESYSDFDLARKKFKECLGASLKDDIYYERSERKLARYRELGKQEEATQ